MKSNIIFVVLTFFLVGLYGFSFIQEKEWIVPNEYKILKNPTDKENGENQAIGRSLYKRFCRSCHGKEGYGDGPEAEEQEGNLNDFSTEEFQNQTDGSLFYKITKGRNDMQNFDKKIPSDEDKWLVVNHLRTLKE